MNASPGIIAAFITLICWTTGTLLYTRAAKLYRPASINRVRLLYALILLTVLTWIISGSSPLSLFEKPLQEHWLWLGISGIIGLSIGDHFTFIAFKLMGSSRTSLFNAFAPGAALIGGYFILGEHISMIGLAGMAISVSGIIWFIQTNRNHNTDKGTVVPSELGKGLLFATLGALCQGLGLVFAKKGLILDTGSGMLSPLHATWMRMFIATIAIYGAGIFKTNLVAEFKAVTFNRRIFMPTISGTLFGPVTGVSMSLYAASLIEVSLAQTIFSLQPVSVIFAVYMLGKETLEPSSVIAAFISVAGVFILAWRETIFQLLFH